MCQICNVLSYLAHTVLSDVSLWMCTEGQEGGFFIHCIFGSLSGQPTSPWLRFSCTQVSLRATISSLWGNQGFLSLILYPLQPCHTKRAPQKSMLAPPERGLEMQTLWPHPQVIHMHIKTWEVSSSCACQPVPNQLYHPQLRVPIRNIGHGAWFRPQNQIFWGVKPRNLFVSHSKGNSDMYQ